MIFYILITSIGRFAVDREFVNIENASQDCAQDHQEDPQGDHFGPRWCPRSPRGPQGDDFCPRLCPRSPRGDPREPFLAQDGAQDRQEEPQGDHFRAKMVSKIAKRSPKGSILEPRWCPRSPRGAPRGAFWSQDCAQDLWPSFLSKSDQNCESVAQNQNLRQLKWPKVCECCSKTAFRVIIFRQKSPKVCECCSKIGLTEF